MTQQKEPKLTIGKDKTASIFSMVDPPDDPARALEFLARQEQRTFACI
jgi:hypothetical protein